MSTRGSLGNSAMRSEIQASPPRTSLHVSPLGCTLPDTLRALGRAANTRFTVSQKLPVLTFEALWLVCDCGSSWMGRHTRDGLTRGCSLSQWPLCVRCGRLHVSEHWKGGLPGSQTVDLLVIKSTHAIIIDLVIQHRKPCILSLSSYSQTSLKLLKLTCLYLEQTCMSTYCIFAPTSDAYGHKMSRDPEASRGPSVP